MRTPLAFLPCLVLAACASQQPVLERTEPRWQIRFQAAQEVSKQQTRFLKSYSWLESLEFPDSASAFFTLHGLAHSDERRDGGNYVDVGFGISLSLQPDEQAHVWFATVRLDRGFDARIENLPEQERWLLRLIHAAPSFQAAEDWNPLHLVRATNALLKLGEDNAAALLSTYLEMEQAALEGQPRLWAPAEGRVQAIAMMLWSGDRLGLSPRVGSGLPDFLWDKLELIRVAGDLPYATCEGFNLGGRAESALPYLERVRREGKWREGPLLPNANPFSAFLEFEVELRNAFIAAGAADITYRHWVQFLRRQALRSVEVEAIVAWKTQIGDSVIPMLAAGADAHGLHWSAERERYEVGD